jgi:Cu/Ag efflux protein CusF
MWFHFFPQNRLHLVSNNVKSLIVVICSSLLLACSRNPESSRVEHRYPLTGKVVSLDPQHQTAMVDAAAIPNFMEAMTMEYPVKSKSDFESLRVGERITATVDVTADSTYSLSNIKPQAASDAQK